MYIYPICTPSFVDIHICIHICIYVYIVIGDECQREKPVPMSYHIAIHWYIFHSDVYTHAHMIYIYICAYVYLCTYIYIYVYACMYVYIVIGNEHQRAEPVSTPYRIAPHVLCTYIRHICIQRFSESGFVGFPRCLVSTPGPASEYTGVRKHTDTRT